MQLLVLFLAAFLAGAVNSVAGGGTLLTFPALLAIGVTPIAANATSTVALVPGSFSAFYAYRSEMRDSRREVLWFALPSLIGGVFGALFVDRVGDRTFTAVVPWLIFGATLLFALQPLVTARVAGAAPHQSARRAPIAMAFQFAVAVYGGFFGAGMGILMLATLGFLGLTGMHRMNGIKNLAAVCINGVAAITFIALGRVRFGYAAWMAIAAILGGLLGARAAKRIGDRNVRRIVIGIGIAIGAAMLGRTG